MKLRWKLKHVMLDREVSLLDMAEAMHIHFNTVSRWRNAKNVPVRGEELESICNYLNCSVADLIEEIR